MTSNHGVGVALLFLVTFSVGGVEGANYSIGIWMTDAKCTGAPSGTMRKYEKNSAASKSGKTCYDWLYKSDPAEFGMSEFAVCNGSSYSFTVFELAGCKGTSKADDTRSKALFHGTVCGAAGNVYVKVTPPMSAGDQPSCAAASGTAASGTAASGAASCKDTLAAMPQNCLNEKPGTDGKFNTVKKDACDATCVSHWKKYLKACPDGTYPPETWGWHKCPASESGLCKASKDQSKLQLNMERASLDLDMTQCTTSDARGGNGLFFGLAMVLSHLFMQG